MISALRKLIPGQVRISTYVVVIATFVTVADFTLQAMLPAAHHEMAAFISLIVVNCIILGRAEAFASKQPGPALDRRRARHGRRLHLALVLIGSDARGARQRNLLRLSRSSGPASSRGWS